MKVITCNIELSFLREDGPFQWSNRRQLCLDTMAKYDPDVICLQECYIDQLKDIRDRFGGDYEVVHGLSEPSSKFPENGILFRKSMFANAGVGAWSLSETPHILKSRSWGSRCYRYANWVLLEREDGSQVRVVSTHYDHISELARQMSSKMINEDAACWGPDLPQIFTGDLNADPHHKEIQMLEEAGWQDSLEGPHKFDTTCHSFIGSKWWPEYEVPNYGCGRLDYIFYRGKLTCRSSEIIKDNIDDRLFPSDHYFVLAEFE